ncbi:MAG: anti-sigma factor [Gemmatimonadaceae bacterium]
MIFSDEVLMAYADGELDSETREQVEDAITKDPDIARRVASHKALREALRSSFDPVLEEPVPDRLITAARTSSRGRTYPRVVPLRRHSAPARSWPKWAAIAASFLLGALVLQFGSNLHTSRSITEQNGQLRASGALERALSNQLAKNQEALAAVQIGVSFRSKSGNYCRTFQLREASALAGLACHEDNKWRVEILARADPSLARNPEYRPAGSALPASVIQAVNESIAGDPLDANAEADARKRQWRELQ